MPKIEVRRAETESDREALYRFRYSVYVEELGMTDQADHVRKWLLDGYDDEATHYALYEDGKVAGSLRVILMARISDPDPLIAKFEMAPAIEAFGASAIITTSRFMIAGHLRNTMAVFRLMREAFIDSKRLGIKLNYGDCSPHLLPFYEHLGYRRYTEGINDTAFGYKLPILMLGCDREHLPKVRSPLARFLEPEDDDPESRLWFAATYPDYVDLVSAAFMEDEMFFDLLAARVGTDPVHAVSLLKGLDKEEARRFLSRATVMKVRPGDKIVRQGDRDNTLYALLSGFAEVRLTGQDGPPIAVLGAGDTFGEIGLLTAAPRTADVIARTEGEVLVLSGDFIERLIETEPKIGARVLHNLARELAGRLAVTTRQSVSNTHC